MTIKEAREAKGISRAELSRGLGIPNTDHAYATFKSGGHGYIVETQYIKKIEPID